jgi:competence protein ComEC
MFLSNAVRCIIVTSFALVIACSFTLSLAAQSSTPEKAPPANKAAGKVSAEKTTAAGEYIGNKESKKFHTPSCRHTQKLTAENKQVFKSVKEAQEAGFEACKLCKPK